MEANMEVEIRVPALGESIVDAVIARWLKSEGDEVNQGEALVELETDKVNVEVSAERSGVLQKILKQAGDEVTVGDVLGMIGESAEVATAVRQETALPGKTPEQQSSNGQRQLESPSVDGQRLVSPLARRIADDNNVDLSQVTSHSSHGRVTKDDVISYLEKTSGQQTTVLSMDTTRQKTTDDKTTTSVVEVSSIYGLPGHTMRRARLQPGQR